MSPMLKCHKKDNRKRVTESTAGEKGAASLALIVGLAVSCI